MIKVILFDCDGPIIKHEKYFSVRLAESRGLDSIDENESQKAFFDTIFVDCKIGKADLKQELGNVLDLWSWTGKVEELMEFWFSGEKTLDLEMKEYILELRAKGIMCYLSTNNEKYRVDYLWNIVGLKNLLDNKLPSCELGYLKPDSNFWQQAFSRIPKVEKSEVLILDDKQPAIDSAKEFGFNAEFYTSFADFKKQMLKYNL